MAEPENLVLDMLRAMRGDMAKMAASMRLMSVEMKAMRQQLAGFATIQDHDHEEIAIISEFLPRQMDDAAVAEAVEAAVATLAAGNIKDMGKVVSTLKKDYAGRMDFAKGSALGKARLSGGGRPLRQRPADIAQRAATRRRDGRTASASGSS